MKRVVRSVAVAVMALGVCAAGYAAGEKVELDGRFYLTSGPAMKENPFLLVWCHPGTGEAQPEFDWWMTNGIRKDNVIVVAPQAKERLWAMPNDEAFVTKVIDKVVKEYKVPANRVILGGHSSGAVFTYAYGLKHQKTFRALVPACGIMQQTPGKADKDSPVLYVYHSTNDPIFKYEKAKEAKATLEGKGYSVTMMTDQQQHSVGPNLVRMVKKMLQRLVEEDKKAAEEAKKAAKTPTNS